MTTLDPLSRAHRAAQIAIRSAALRDFLVIWQGFDIGAIARTWGPVQDATVILIRDRGRQSAGIAGRYYRDIRRDAGVTGRAPTPRATPTVDEIVGGLRTMGPLNAAKQLTLRRAADDVARATLVNLSGVVSKYVLDHGRDVLVNAVADDLEARGWRRSSSGAPCSFCSMLVGRGAVFKSEQSASFDSHRHCACLPVPVF